MSLKLSNPFCINNDTSQIVTRDITKLITQFTENLIYNTITPLKFERFPEDFHLSVNIMTLTFSILLLIRLNQMITIDHLLFIFHPQMKP